jgi:spartin
MAITPEEAHILITLPNATLTSPSTGTLTGQLSLEYITFDIPASAVTRDVLLVLRLDNGAFEAPLDPARTLTASVQSSGAARRYVFHATQDDAEFTLEIPVTPETSDDVELFHSVLVGYVTDLRDGVPPTAPAPGVAQNGVGLVVGEAVQTGDDLRGRFVLVNEDNGEVVGALGRSVRVYEDPSLGKRGHEGDPVVVELPEGASTLDDVEVLVRTVPPEDRDWMMKGAVFVRHVPHLSSYILCKNPV